MIRYIACTDRVLLGMSVLLYTLSMALLKFREFHLGFFEVHVTEAKSTESSFQAPKKSWLQYAMKALGTSSRVSMRVRGHVTRAIMSDMMDEVAGTETCTAAPPPPLMSRSPSKTEPSPREEGTDTDEDGPPYATVHGALEDHDSDDENQMQM